MVGLTVYLFLYCNSWWQCAWYKWMWAQWILVEWVNQWARRRMNKQACWCHRWSGNVISILYFYFIFFNLASLSSLLINFHAIRLFFFNPSFTQQLNQYIKKCKYNDFIPLLKAFPLCLRYWANIVTGILNFYDLAFVNVSSLVSCDSKYCNTNHWHKQQLTVWTLKCSGFEEFYFPKEAFLCCFQVFWSVPLGVLYCPSHFV